MWKERNWTIVEKLDNSTIQNRQLNEVCDYICEVYHDVSYFNDVLKDIAEYIQKLTEYKDYQTDWIWVADEQKCRKSTDVESVGMCEFPIWVHFFKDSVEEYDAVQTNAYIKERYEEPNRVVICISVNFIKTFTAASKEELFHYCRNTNLYHFGKDIYPYLKGNLKHEIVHIFHDYNVKGPLLKSFKNRPQTFMFNDFPDKIKNQFKNLNGEINARFFNIVAPLMYFTGDSEITAHLNGYSAWLDEYDAMMIEQMCDGCKTRYEFVKECISRGDEFNKVSIYKMYVERFADLTADGFYQPAIIAGYILWKYHMQPCGHLIAITDDYFVKNYQRFSPKNIMNLNVTEKEEVVFNEIANFFTKKFKKYYALVSGKTYEILHKKNII